jgi:hypothetical protein
MIAVSAEVGIASFNCSGAILKEAQQIQSATFERLHIEASGHPKSASGR